ncbi:hypothetical protein CAPTEDRAFT_203434 [Capitella teleta]|uniref:Integrin alpha-2 domain-containing protein n=1 Tax=Capitella teleta TaxID=283909 RepID=R7VAB7_CAPTE|nr:hypothetical protein CAPTEDRAFT_203434 [Capitella teleta]|eukprot:ELU15482.1 hypothetical protein CAPTEDRAFT_203434 [Capitella teleta]
MERCTVFWILCALLRTSLAFNVDTENHVVHSGPTSSKFGFTVKQFVNQEGKWLVIGAPEAETSQTGVYRPGVVYKCRAQNPSECYVIPFDTTGNNQEWNGYAYIQTENKTQQWLGATLSTSSDNGAIVACAPRYVYFSRKGDKREPIGMCYVSAPDMDTQKFTPCKHYYDLTGGGELQKGDSIESFKLIMGPQASKVIE